MVYKYIVNVSLVGSTRLSVHLGSDYKDMSTCGGLHLVGSDLTRTHGRSDINLNEYLRSEQRNIREQGNTPMHRTKPVASRESGVSGHESQGVGRSNRCDEGDNTTSCHFTQEKRFKKTSSV